MGDLDSRRSELTGRGPHCAEAWPPLVRHLGLEISSIGIIRYQRTPRLICSSFSTLLAPRNIIAEPLALRSRAPVPCSLPPVIFIIAMAHCVQHGPQGDTVIEREHRDEWRRVSSARIGEEASAARWIRIEVPRACRESHAIWISLSYLSWSRWKREPSRPQRRSNNSTFGHRARARASNSVKIAAVCYTRGIGFVVSARCEASSDELQSVQSA